MSSVKASHGRRASHSAQSAKGRSPGSSPLDAYLPLTLVDQVANHRGESPFWGRWLTGSLMHCDLAGFTAMSESLAHMGKEGTEVMAGVLNSFFERMLEIADRWNGDQMKFGGDSMLIFFDGHHHASRAVACGLDMQTAMRQFRTVTAGEHPYQLRMRAGVHSGRFFVASVGRPVGTLHCLIVGEDVNRTCRVEVAGALGKVVASDETVALLPDGSFYSQTSPGIWQIISHAARPPRRPTRSAPRAPPDTLRRYLTPPIANRLARTQDLSFLAEHRRVTMQFINVLGIVKLLKRHTQGEALRQIGAYMETIISTVERHGGVLAGSDASDAGAKLWALFGAPIAHEHQEARSLRCALELHRQLEESGVELRHRIGVHAGLAFAGEIGSRRRREYSVIGDNVNLAARLMAAAKVGETLVSRGTIERAGDEFLSERLRPIRVKGRSEPVSIRRLTGARTPADHHLAPRRDFPLAGRRSEMSSLMRAASRAAAGRSRWVHVSGEAGIGKSRVVAEVARRLTSQGWRLLTTHCQPHRSGTPFGAWRPPLRDLFGITGATQDEGLKRIRKKILHLRPDLEMFAPLVGDLLSLPIKDAGQLASLDAKTRRHRLTDTVAEVLCATAREQPVMLLMEDLHWADSPSVELLRDVLSRLAGPILVATTSRHGRPPPGLAGRRPAVWLHLAELDPDDARTLVATAAALADEEVEAIVAKAQGNPLFLQELARSDPRRSAVPDTIDDVLMARLDSLPHDEKALLRIASVIGPSFDLAPLKELASDSVAVEGLNQKLTNLVERGFVAAQGIREQSFVFNHGLVQEVAYETLPFAQRRRLHLTLGGWLENQFSGRPEQAAELLLHHFDLAGNTRKAAVYAAISGDRAASMFANKEAIDYYQRALTALDDAGGSDCDRSFITERIADCTENSGSHDQAAGTFLESLNQWTRAKSKRPRLVPWSAVPASREAELCRKAAVSYERNADYGESMRWLDMALSALPRRPGRVGASVYGAMSVALSRKGNFSEGIRWARRSLEVARRSGDVRGIAYAQNMLGGSYMDLGAPKRAIRHLRSAVHLYHEISDLIGQASANNNLGMCYHLLGDLATALDYYKVALRADRQAGDVVDTAIARNNIGEVLLAVDRPEEALTELQAASEAHQSGGDASLAGLALVNMSRAQVLLGDLESAERLLRRGTRLMRSVGAEGLLTEARLQLAELRLAQGLLSPAYHNCRGAIASAREAEARLLEARGERVLGAILAARGQHEDARAHVRVSIRLSRRLGATHEEAHALAALARLHVDHGVGTHGEASQALRRAHKIPSTMTVTSHLTEVAELQMRLRR